MGRGRRAMLLALSIVLVLIGGVGLLWHFVTRPVAVVVEAELPSGFPEDVFSHAAFEGLLRQFVDAEGGVRYGQWHQDATARRQLDRYLAAVAAYSPDNAPGRFPTHNDRLAYWMYAYNAFVIKAVLDRWPLESVTEVKAPLELVKGLGFFYTLQFTAGRKRYSLYEIEHHQVIRRHEDPRVHFVLNCGSGSCPAMRPELPTGEALEPHLARAARDFVSDERNVRIDHERREIALSKIFAWYEDEFIADLRRRGLPASNGIVDYVASVGPQSLAAEIDRARSYKVIHREYDWAVNEARTGGEAP